VATTEELVDLQIAKLDEEGYPSRDDVKVWWRWCEHLVNILEGLGYFYRGESWKYQGWSTLLVLKVARDGVPLVVFYTERNTTACMRGLLKQLDEGSAQFRKDQFA